MIITIIFVIWAYSYVLLTFDTEDVKKIFDLAFQSIQRTFQMQVDFIKSTIDCFVGNRDSNDILDDDSNA